MMGLVFIWVAVIWLLPIWTARNQFRNQPAARGIRTVSIDETRIHARWNGGSVDTVWQMYIRSFESRNQFLLYTSPACFRIIPNARLILHSWNLFAPICKKKSQRNRRPFALAAHVSRVL